MTTKRDRELLRSRVKARLEQQGRSQKDLEASLGWSSGTLTRVFGGKKTLDPELLAVLAEGLGAEAHELVEGTEFAAVPGEPVPPPEPRLAAPEPVSAPLEPRPSAVRPAIAPEPDPPPGPAPAREAAPAPEPIRLEPPPPREERRERRTRKRDLPLRALRFLSGWIFG